MKSRRRRKRSARAVLTLFGITTAKCQHRGTCPLHGSTSGTSRCFLANLDQNIFHCFKCGRSGNALDLYAAVTRQTPYDAAVDLCAKQAIPLPLLANKGNREEEPVRVLSKMCTMPQAQPEPDSSL